MNNRQACLSFLLLVAFRWQRCSSLLHTSLSRLCRDTFMMMSRKDINPSCERRLLRTGESQWIQQIQNVYSSPPPLSSSKQDDNDIHVHPLIGGASSPSSSAATTQKKNNTINSFDTYNRKKGQSNKNNNNEAAKIDNNPDERDAKSSNSQNPSVPRHVALVLDGNGRWAQKRHLPISVGHAKGAGNVIEMLRHLKAAGVKYCTLFAFSTENWQRCAEEVQHIMNIMERTSEKFHDMAAEEGLSIRILGGLDDLPVGLRRSLLKLEMDTADLSANSKSGSDGTAMTVCLAINYGGRKDIINAAKQMAEAMSRGDVDVDNITEEIFEGYLSTAGIPDPDLLIRTGGERRLSNFLLWDAAYAELYFSDELWPDFGDECLKDALQWYAHRDRRFGRRRIEENAKQPQHESRTIRYNGV